MYPMRVMLFLRITYTGICSIFVQVTCICTTGGARYVLRVNVSGWSSDTDNYVLLNIAIFNVCRHLV